MKTQLPPDSYLSQSADSVLLVLQWSPWNLAQHLLLNDSIPLLDLNRQLLGKGVNLVLVLLVEDRNSVQQHKHFCRIEVVQEEE